MKKIILILSIVAVTSFASSCSTPSDGSHRGGGYGGQGGGLGGEGGGLGGEGGSGR